jgi:hypothetical protein
MAITYDDLRARIGNKLGYGYAKSDWTSNAQKTELVERCLKSGLSRFYDPPGDPKHFWSFLRPTLTLDLVAGQYAYDLPANFVSFEGPLHHAPGQTDWYPPIQIAGAEQVQERLGESDDPGRPCIAGVRVKAAQDVSATAWELIVHPVPDANYQVKAATKINPTLPGQATDIPLGGQPHEQTLIEACLAECELFDELEDRSHHQRFLECLQSSISHDRRVSGAQTLGYNGDPSNADVEHPWRDYWNVPAVTYQGQYW